MRVYAWIGWYQGNRVRQIVACDSVAEADRIASKVSPLMVSDLSETYNATELEVAEAKPGEVFWMMEKGRFTKNEYHPMAPVVSSI